MEKSGFLEQNIEESNKLVAKIMAFTSIFLVLAWILNLAGVFIIKNSIMTIACIIGIIVLFVPIVCIYLLKLDPSVIKYINVTCASIFVSIMAATLSIHIVIIYIPYYYSKHLFY